MTDRSPSLMIPGEWASRQKSSPPHTEAAQPAERRSNLFPNGATESVRPPTRPAVSPEWPRWAKISLFVGLLLAGMLLAMWGASISDSL